MTEAIYFVFRSRGSVQLVAQRQTILRIVLWSDLWQNELALQHSWAGLQGKIPFGGLTIMTTICGTGTSLVYLCIGITSRFRIYLFFLTEAVKRNPLAKNPTDLDVENVKYWLKRAMNRIKAAQVIFVARSKVLYKPCFWNYSIRFNFQWNF